MTLNCKLCRESFEEPLPPWERRRQPGIVTTGNHGHKTGDLIEVSDLGTKSNDLRADVANQDSQLEGTE